MTWCSFKINEKNKCLIHVPSANAFLTLENNTIVQYNSSQFYKPSHEKGIRYNDPSFKFKWPHKPKGISFKDLSHSNYTVKKFFKMIKQAVIFCGGGELDLNRYLKKYLNQWLMYVVNRFWNT